MSKDCLDVVTPFPGPTRCRPSQPPKRKSLYPNLSQYAANRAQTVQIEPNGAFSCQQLRGEPEPITRLLNRSIKVEVKKKHISCGWNFSCFAAHLMERNLF